MVHSAHYANQSSRSALKLAQAVIERGHSLEAIFFYQDGIYHAGNHIDIPSDELNTQDGFIELNQQYQVPLLLCVTAAEKRGINENELADAFTVAGLAEMAAITATVDRLVQFK